MKKDELFCQVKHPNKREFSRPFAEYVSEIFGSQPDLPMFKMVPPKGWRARKNSYPRLDTLQVHTPIEQNVIGLKGVFRCILVEKKDMTAKQFKEMANSERYLRPKRSRGTDENCCEENDVEQARERTFWSNIITNPPIYGADTPQSLFDEHLDWGWNLKNLGCLLKQHKVPFVPGVTAPMTYFGMWKSFFTWHTEDADLYSINYHHFGEPKIWYCVSPKHRKKFEDMASSIFPELSKSCKAFLRHKDILLSPNILNHYHIPYKMAIQQPGEFIVLNAGAYHAGYNLGYNCAEAINFALEQWVTLGKNAVQCSCGLLKDGVRIDMDLFQEPESEPCACTPEKQEQENKKRKQYVVRINRRRLKAIKCNSGQKFCNFEEQ